MDRNIRTLLNSSRRHLGWLLLGLCLTACTGLAPAAETTPPTSTAALLPTVTPGEVLPLTGYLRAHDPVIAKTGDRYYVFTTGSRIPFLCSDDMRAWEFCGRVFNDIPAWVQEAVPGVGDLWAPDIAYFNDKWHLYYAGSTFGHNRSVIGLVTNTTLDPDDPAYEWVDEGLVIESQPSDDWNAIDPNIAFDEAGQPWLSWGSYWSGIKLRRIDPATGKPPADAPLQSIAARPRTAPGSEAIEAPFIIRRGAYFYLFVSFDACCQGLNSTYKIMVGRAAQIDGHYVDRDGNALTAGGGTLVLASWQQYKGPGHNAVFHEDGTDWLVYHAYATAQAGEPVLRIEALGWDDEGWPIAPSSLNSGSP
jgi:arabinan endo-1,5-alpha-L-arabinosidase